MKLPPELEVMRTRIDEALSEAVGAEVADLVSLHPDLAPLADELAASTLSSGKRLRPLLVLLGWEAGSGGPYEVVLDAALAVEFVHVCALVHDDIIDGAASRRGRDAAHVGLSSRHRRLGWDGPPDRFGTSAAILLGDLMLVLADRLFAATSGLPGYDEAFQAYTTMRVEVTAGQFLDVAAAASGATTVSSALMVAEYKSGRYSVARPLEVGALLAGDRAVADGLVRAGIPLGVAFQLRDDLLGVFGTEEATGKSTVSDLAEGKRTFLVATTLERLDAAGRERFDRLFGRRDLDSAGVQELRHLIDTSGARHVTEQRINELVADADRIVARLALPERSAAVLTAVGASVADRSF